MSIIQWPDDLFKPSAFPSIDLVSQDATGGKSLAGVERFREGAPSWVMTFPLRLRGSAQILTWTALRTMAKGRYGVFSIPTYDCGRSPAALPDYKLAASDVPHSDDALFSDDTPYLGHLYHVSVSIAAPVRATSMVMTIEDTPAVAPYPGMVFSIPSAEAYGAERLYLLETVGKISGGACAITFLPPLREAVPAGAPLHFDRARGLWRFADSAQGRLPMQAASQSIDLTISFVEAQILL